MVEPLFILGMYFVAYLLIARLIYKRMRKNMKIKVWVAIIDCGDGSHTVNLYPSEEKLRQTENIDEEGFYLAEEFAGEVPVEVEWEVLEITGEYEVVS